MRFSWLYLRFVFICSLSMMSTGILMGMYGPFVNPQPEPLARRIYEAQAGRAQLLAQLSSFKASMNTLYETVIQSELGDVPKFGILRHLINVINKVATYPMSVALNERNYLVGLYQALSKCPHDEVIKNLIVQRLEYSVATTTKIMASLSAFFTYRTVKNIPILLPQMPAFANFKALLDDAIELLQDKIPIEKSVLLDASSLCQPNNKPVQGDVANVQTLITSLQRTAQQSNDMYALVALSQLLSDAYQEQFKLENQLLFGQQRQATAQKDILNNILQITYITNATIGYHYLLRNISSLKRYLLTTAAAENALQKLAEAIKNYITDQQALFNSVIDGTTLSFLKKASPAQIAKTHFDLIGKTFNLIKDDTQYQYHDYALQTLFTLLKSPNTPENAHILQQQSSQSIYTSIKQRINTQFGITIWWNSLGWRKTDFDKAFTETMEQWAIATIQQLKATQQQQALL